MFPYFATAKQADRKRCNDCFSCQAINKYFRKYLFFN